MAAFSTSICWEREEATLRVVIDQMRCESNAVCMGLVPEVFEIGDDDLLYVLDENPPESLRSRLHKAAMSCPREAISLLDD
jgi:ferredoxin